MENLRRIDKLRQEGFLNESELKTLLTTVSDDEEQYLYRNAREVCDGIYGKNIYVRGLVEFSNYCKNDCKYCGIRRSNKNASRYRLTAAQILECADIGYKLGFRTIVLQSGEDLAFSDDDICNLISQIKQAHSDVAVTLSIGEKTYAQYKSYYEAGADRYLLRHETSNPQHYGMLHTPDMSHSNRLECLNNLKSIGYQVGCGFMVGSPYQTWDNIMEDLMFIKKFEPHMVGIGPFIAHAETPFKDMPNGTARDTLHLLSVIRLLMPRVLLPSTTALGTIDIKGRELGILAGANVVMPNLSPLDVRKKYNIYDGKICTGEEAAECKVCLEKRIEQIGYKICTDRGDYKFK